MLIAATLNDFVHAFDTSQNPGSILWEVDLLGGATQGQHCGQGGAPFVGKNYNGDPGGTNLAYYGAVATPVIDTAVSGHPVLHVVSACVPSGSPKQIGWFLDAIDLTTGAIVGTTPIADPPVNQQPPMYFNSAYELSRGSLLVTHPSTGGATATYVYATFGTGGRENGAEQGPTKAYSGALFAYG
jgi:hypothetical protein